MKDLTERIFAYLDERNLQPTRYVWQAKGQEILQKIQRAHKALARQTNVPPDIKGTLH